MNPKRALSERAIEVSALLGEEEKRRRGGSGWSRGDSHRESSPGKKQDGFQMLIFNNLTRPIMVDALGSPSSKDFSTSSKKLKSQSETATEEPTAGPLELSGGKQKPQVQSSLSRVKLILILYRSPLQEEALGF